jgi:hypothetical protein
LWFLLGLLALMLAALWYDYKVARPAVEDAYERIARLNSEINSRPGKMFMTNKDVQNELKRTPIRQFSEGGYMVEVYGWRSGLPTNTHNYYAVYVDAAPYIFLKHYMNKLEKTELAPLVSEGEVNTDMSDLEVGRQSAISSRDPRRPPGPDESSAPADKPSSESPAK